MGRPRLRDPRLWLGVVLVAGSALAGGRLLADDDTVVGVWTVPQGARTGDVLTRDDLAVADVTFDDAATRDHYLLAARGVPDDLVVAYPLTPGELLPHSAVDPEVPATPELPLGVLGADLPADLEPGDHVAVWSAPDGAVAGGRVALVLADVTVGDVSGNARGDLLAPRQVVLELPSLSQVGVALRGLGGARPVLVRVGD